MGYSKMIEPGRWYAEFDENGNKILSVCKESLCRLLGYESEAEFA